MVTADDPPSAVNRRKAIVRVATRRALRSGPRRAHPRTGVGRARRARRSVTSRSARPSSAASPRCRRRWRRWRSSRVNGEASCGSCGIEETPIPVPRPPCGVSDRRTGFYHQSVKATRDCQRPRPLSDHPPFCELRTINQLPPGTSVAALTYSLSGHPKEDRSLATSRGVPPVWSGPTWGKWASRNAGQALLRWRSEGPTQGRYLRAVRATESR